MRKARYKRWANKKKEVETDKMARMMFEDVGIVYEQQGSDTKKQ